MRKNDLKPWLQDKTYLIPFIGVVLILASPILLPVSVLWHVRDELYDGVVAYYHECVGAFKKIT